MIFKYSFLKDVISDNKKVQIDDESYVKKLDNLNGIEYVVSESNDRDYYVFVDIDDNNGVVINSDNHTDMGYFIFETVLQEFYFEVNVGDHMVNFYNGPGNETEFADIMSQEEVAKIYDEYHNYSDEELRQTRVYKNLDTYVSKYLELPNEVENEINLVIMRLAFITFEDKQNNK